MKVPDFLKPNAVKAFFTAVFMVFTLAIAGMILYSDINITNIAVTLVVLAVGLAASYIAACIFHEVYRRTNNKWVRLLLVAVAIILSFGAAAVLIILFYLATRPPPIICDPVHEPPVICDPVHQPSGPVNTEGLFAGSAVSEAARQKYKELMKKL